MAHARSLDETGFHRDGQVPVHRGRTLPADDGHLAADAVDAVHAGASELRHGAKRAVASAKSRLSEDRGVNRRRYEAARNAASDAAESVRDVIVRNPVASAGVAAGVAVVIGLMLRRLRPRK